MKKSLMLFESREPVEKKVERKPPSITLYLGLISLAELLMIIVFISPDGIWQNFFLNLSTNIIVAIIILIVIEQKFRESDINLVKEFYESIQVFLLVFIPFVNFRFSIYLRRVSNKFYLGNFNQNYVLREIDEIILNMDKNVIIIGNNGSGKTSLLIRTFIKKIKNTLKNEDSRIPVFISLFKVENSLKESFINEINNYSWISEKNFEEYLEKGLFIFILDDVVADYRPQVWSDLIKFIEKYPLCQYIFATPRINKENLSELKDFYVAELPSRYKE